jgi:HK97 family phage major capsid protein
MTIKEQISSFEAKRAANVGRMDELVNKAGEEVRTFDEVENEEHERLDAEVKAIDKHLVILRGKEQQAIATATAITTTTAGTPATASAARGGSVKVVGANLEKGIPFARMAMALYAAKGDRELAAKFVEQNSRWMSTTPELAGVIRSAVSLGTSTASGWAAELAPLQNYTGDFVELLRPQTLVGRIPGFKMVPFNVSIKTQDQGTEGSWVGEGGRKPVGKLNFDTIELKYTKIAKIVAITEELVRLSTPAAEGLVRDDLIKGLAEGIDKAFVTVSNAGTSNVKPASVLYNAQNQGASGPTVDDVIADVKDAFAQFTNNNIPLSGLCWLMQESQAVALSLMLSPLGQPQFPGMSVNGGTFFGFPVYVSQNVGSGIIGLIKPSEILMADDGGARVDVSNEATLVMDDGESPEGTTTVSMYQENALAIRAERWINWKLRRTDAAYYISSTDYGAGS